MAKRRRQRGEGSIWQRESDGMWLGAIDVGYVNGKRRRKVVSSKKQSEVVRKLREARKAIDAGDSTTTSMRLDKWLLFWLDNIAPERAGRPLKPKTLVDYRSKVEQYLIPTIGTRKLNQLTPAHVRAMHRDLRERVGEDGKPLSATTIHHAHRVLCNALNAAMREVGLASNAAKTVPAPAKAKSRRRSLSRAEVRAILLTAANDPMASRWLFALLTGARQGECLGLRRAYVDIEGGFADLAWSLQRVRYRHGCLKDGAPTCGRKKGVGCRSKVLDINPALEFEQLEGNLCLVRPKTEGSKRLVPLPLPLVTALQVQEIGPNPHGLVWHRPDGSPIPPRDDWVAWHALLDRAGVPSVTLHEARHTAVTGLSDLGVDPRVIAQVVGHSSVLAQVDYRHLDMRLAADALGQWAKAIEG